MKPKTRPPTRAKKPSSKKPKKAAFVRSMGDVEANVVVAAWKKTFPKAKPITRQHVHAIRSEERAKVKPPAEESPKPAKKAVSHSRRAPSRTRADDAPPPAERRAGTPTEEHLIDAWLDVALEKGAEQADKITAKGRRRLAEIRAVMKR